MKESKVKIFINLYQDITMNIYNSFLNLESDTSNDNIFYSLHITDFFFCPPVNSFSLRSSSLAQKHLFFIFLIFFLLAEETDDIPKPDYRPPIVIPKEEYGEGCNSKIYYVCNDGEILFSIKRLRKSVQNNFD